MSTLLAVVILALATLSGLTVYVVRVVVSYRIDHRLTVPDPSDHSRSLDRHEAEIITLRNGLADLVLAVDDGIRRVDRAESRIQKTVTSARRLVKESGLEHAGIEAEASELRDRDDERVEPLPAVPTPVESPRAVRIPGGTLQIGAP